MILTGPRLQRVDDCGSTSKRQHTDNDIVFMKADLWRVQTSHNDAVVVSMIIANYDIKKYLIDNESSIDVIFYDYFFRMRWLSTELLKLVNVSVVRFTDDSIKVKGTIELSITVRKPPRQSIVYLNFLIAWVPSAYNIILGPSELNALRAVISTYHLLMCFPTRNGSDEIQGDQQLVRQCYLTTLNEKKNSWIDGIHSSSLLYSYITKVSNQLFGEKTYNLAKFYSCSLFKRKVGRYNMKHIICNLY